MGLPFIAEFLGRVFETSDAMDRREAAGWAVAVVDLAEGATKLVAHGYGLFDSPEEALVAAGLLDETMREQMTAEEAETWQHVVVPIFSFEERG